MVAARVNASIRRHNTTLPTQWTIRDEGSHISGQCVHGFIIVDLYIISGITTVGW